MSGGENPLIHWVRLANLPSVFCSQVVRDPLARLWMLWLRMVVAAAMMPLKASGCRGAV